MNKNPQESLSQRDQSLIWHPFTQMKTAGTNRAIVRGEGALLIDETGKRYIDAIGSWWVNLHGHAHPHISAMIGQQANQLSHVMFAGFTHEPAVALCERLQRWLPRNLKRFFYSDNGSTAIEIALKMALQYQHAKTGPNQDGTPLKVIAFENAYHGDTFGAMSVGERDVFVNPFLPYLFDVIYIPAPTPGNERESLNQLETAIREHQVAALIFEPLIQAAGGMRMYEPAALDSLLEVCRNHQVLSIADEVMTGFFKTGTCFAIHQLRQQVDFICLSKALTSGTLPLALTVTTEDIFQAFYDDDTSKAFFHGHSYTGNPIGCVAALASLDLIEGPGFKKNQQRVTSYLTRQAGQYRSGLGKKDSLFRDVRHKGLVIALEMNVSQTDGYLSKLAPWVYEQCMQRGVLVRPLGEVIYVVPPVCISKKQLDQVFSVIEEVVGLVLQEAKQAQEAKQG